MIRRFKHRLTETHLIRGCLQGVVGISLDLGFLFLSRDILEHSIFGRELLLRFSFEATTSYVRLPSFIETTSLAEVILLDKLCCMRSHMLSDDLLIRILLRDFFLEGYFLCFRDNSQHLIPNEIPIRDLRLEWQRFNRRI